MPLIDKQIIRKVENQLRGYPQYLTEYTDQRNELLHSTPRPEGERTGNRYIGRPTEQRGVALAELAEGWGGCITQALKRMPWEHKRVVEEFYFKGLKRWQVAEKLFVSETVVQVWKNDARLLVLMLATQRGLIKPIQEEMSDKNDHYTMI